jgi:multiple sugar transport system permease protein
MKARTTNFLRKNAGGLTFILIVIIMLVYVILPLYELVITSFKLQIDALAIPKVFFPRRYSVENYTHVFNMANMRRHFLNSLVVASCSSIICLAIGTPCAFVLVRARFPKKLTYFLTYWILFTRMVPPVSTMLPYFLIMRSLGLLDTRVALIISDTCFNLPFVIWLLMGLIKELPIELEEAARIDGCSNFGVLTRIVIPLLIPGLVSAGTLVFIFSWNDFIYPLFLSSIKAKTLAVVMPGFITDKGLLWGPMTALGSLMIIPVVIVALSFQRYLVRGLTLGAIK